MKRVLILGAGALGSNLTANLASDFRNEVDITVLDFDKIEERNVQAGTQFYMPNQIGQFKVDALQYNIYQWFGKEIKTRNEQFSGHSTFGDYNLVIDCFDNQASRALIQKLWNGVEFVKTKIGKVELEKNNLTDVFSLLHCGFSPKMTFEISWAENYEVPEDSKNPVDICEMQGAASFIKTVAGVAGTAVGSFLNEEKKRYFIGNRFSVREMI
jgi:hypothetical protein